MQGQGWRPNAFVLDVVVVAVLLGSCSAGPLLPSHGQTAARRAHSRHIPDHFSGVSGSKAALPLPLPPPLSLVLALHPVRGVASVSVFPLRVRAQVVP